MKTPESKNQNQNCEIAIRLVRVARGREDCNEARGGYKPANTLYQLWLRMRFAEHSIVSIVAMLHY